MRKLTIQQILIYLFFVECEYHIRNGYVPSYLYHQFIEMNDRPFPHKIMINMTLTKIEGTLLYTIDKMNNQLIVSLNDELVEKLKIEFRGEEHHYSLFELCGCKHCKYRLISLTIKIANEFINIECNQQNYIIHYTIGKLINIAYPQLNNTQKHQAEIWLVNTPAHGNYYPNNDQLMGCIHGISYKDQSLSMEIFGNAITKNCPISCTNNICNSGICYETFEAVPFCDCTDSYMNGPFCNTSGLRKTNKQILINSQSFKFKQIKLSWCSNSTEIFYMSNKNYSLSIQTKENIVCLITKSKTGNQIDIIESSISDQYNLSTHTILIITFENKLIKTKITQHNKTFNEITYLGFHLTELYYVSIILLNGTGEIDIQYKIFDSDIQWNTFDFSQFHFSQFVQKYYSVTSPQSSVPLITLLSTKIIPINIFIILMLIMLIVILYRKSIRYRKKYPRYVLK